MNKNSLKYKVVQSSLIIAVLLAVLAFALPASAQGSGPTTGNCFSAVYHAATDCDRLASGFNTTRTVQTAEEAHWAYLRERFTGVSSPYLMPVTGGSAP